MKYWLIACVCAFFLGMYISNFISDRELTEKQKEYDRLQSKYDTLYLEYEIKLKISEGKRTDLAHTVDSLDMRIQVLHDSLKRPKPKDFKSLTSKQLEEYMLNEYKNR